MMKNDDISSKIMQNDESIIKNYENIMIIMR